MSRRNGSIVGPDIITTSVSASGVWSIEEVYNAKKNNVWPLRFVNLQYLLIGGGAGGNVGNSRGPGQNGNLRGGGGAGGYLEGTVTFLPSATYTITIGAGSSGSGGTSIFDNIQAPAGPVLCAIGGGVGAADAVNTSRPGASGGSGGGAGNQRPVPAPFNYCNNGGLGTPGQGNNGGSRGPVGAGGGGGACNAGTAGHVNGAGGGSGCCSCITGNNVLYAYGGSAPNIFQGSGATPVLPANIGAGGRSTIIGQPGTTPGQTQLGSDGVLIFRYPIDFEMTNSGGGLTFSHTTDGIFRVTTITAGTGNVEFILA